MIDFSFQNYGTHIQITNNETNYKLEEISGLNGFERNVNLLDFAGKDGSSCGTSKIPSREIVATISIVGNIETNRLNLIRALRHNRNCILFFETENRHVYIEGLARNADINAFSEKQAGQIAFICANPFFHKYNNTETSVSPGSSYTAVNNDGDIPIGFRVGINLTSISGDPTKLEIEKNDSDGTHRIVINYPDGFQSGDSIVIQNEYQNYEKSVVLHRDGQSINLISGVDRVSTEWFYLNLGNNNMRYRIGGNYSYGGNHSCLITHREDYISL